MFVISAADAREDIVSFAVPPRLVRPQDRLMLLQPAKLKKKRKVTENNEIQNASLLRDCCISIWGLRNFFKTFCV